MLEKTKIPIYIVHHLPNTERRAYVEEQFNKQNLYFEFVTGFDPSEISKPNSDTITVREYSLYLKFNQALKNLLDTQADYCIIFEDDILLCNNFKEYFDIFFPQFQGLNGDMLIIGTAFNEAPTSIQPNINVYWEERYKTRCAHAILYTKKTAEIVINELHNGSYRGFDHKLNDIITEKKLKVCWLEPGLHQGSIGETPHFKFPTSIR
jgi:GR25 family glycosyltransferase involved in LPS biosynthesis